MIKRNLVNKWYYLILLISVLIVSYYPIVAAGVQLTIEGTITEPSCTINNGRDIDVDFKEVVTTRVDGINYRQSVPYSLSCSINNAPNNKPSWKMQIKGTSAGFGTATNVLKTNNENLGIAITRGNNKVTLNSFEWINPLNLPKLYATLVKRPGTTITVGKKPEFSAAATMVLEYQ